MKVFVSGADGFIGSHLAEALVVSGADVTALAMYNSFDSCGWLDESPLRGDMRIERGDIRDAEQMRCLLKGQDVVYHLAALISVPHSYVAPQSHFETNVMGTMNVLQGAVDAEKIVCTSTSEVYGTAQYTPMGESHPISPQSPYAASKVGADAVCRAFNKSYSTPVVILRPFNTYGPRQSERAFVSTAIRQALDPAVKTMEFGDLAPKRDLTYVTDTVAAFLAISQLEGFDVKNAGHGKSVAMVDLVDMIASKVGFKQWMCDEDRMRPKDSEVMDLVADASLLHDLTGWEPKVSLDEGIDKTIEWWRERSFRPGAGNVV